ncbi:APC family permease [Tuberibacillus sp. Marseille-P3662]|uniref:APC family permease n=1 Tax=Tuberibacillus sp. Marseille-P3662 TaxID=1965358 RepID=UPI00111C48AD|nr:APC family permease [Tuberibacillus sp. Marseille-P3662]
MEEREKLDRTLKPRWVWAIAFGSAVGWGAFVLPTDWLAKAGPLAAAIGFFIGAILMIIIGISYGYLIKNHPVSGGEFAYAYLGFGRNHAFFAGWFLVLGYMSIVALNASALALLVKFTLPEIAKVGLMYQIAGWNVYAGEVIIACLALIVFAILNIRGASITGRTQFIFCLLLILGIIILSISMFSHPDTVTTNLEPLFKPGVPAISAILSIVAIAPWAYVGFDNIPQAAEEFNFSPKKAVWLIIFALLAAAITYSVMIFSTAVAAPWTELVQQESIWGTGDAVSSVLGQVGVLILSLALLMGVFTGLNGFYVSSSRLLFAMGRAQILPRSFAKLHPKYNTPYVGILFTCGITLMAPFFGREVLLWIVDMTSVGVTIAYFYCCAVAFKKIAWSSQSTTAEGEVSPLRKTIAFIGMLSGAAFLGLLIIPGAPGFLSTPSWVALLVWMVLGIVFYIAKARTFHKIPESELDYLILGDQENRK